MYLDGVGFLGVIVVAFLAVAALLISWLYRGNVAKERARYDNWSRNISKAADWFACSCTVGEEGHYV